VIEQKKKLENVLVRLEKSDKEKDRILKAVSHDIRSPVNSAIALADLLLSDESSLTSEQVEYITLIKNSCLNALNLTKDLLEIATIHSEQIGKQNADINQLLKSTVSMLMVRAVQKKQTINLHLPEETVYAEVNEEKIARVINNLVSNAMKFSNVGKDIDFRLWREDNGLIISVHDNGIGIPEAIKDKVFDIFTEAKRFGTEGEEPYGLGLSITKQIIEMHGGKIWFESTYGRETTFYIYLPA
jgi:signal transduction histidine kinase